MRKASEILRLAARNVEVGRYMSFPSGISMHNYACWAIEGVSNSLAEEAAAREWLSSFCPFRTEGWDKPWFGPNTVEENRDRRIIALTMAAAMAESAGE